jgi:hypothetical protein
MEKEALYETRGNTMNTDEIDLTEVGLAHLANRGYRLFEY